MLPPPPASSNRTPPPTTARASLPTGPVFHSTVQHHSGAEPPIFAGSPPATTAPPTSLPSQPPPPLSVPPPPPPAPPLAPGSAPPLTTRVSGAALRGTASSRASSNGGGSRASSNHSQRGRRGSLGESEHPPAARDTAASLKSTSSLFAFAPEKTTHTPTTTTTPGAPAYVGSGLDSRSNSNLNAHTTTAAAIAATRQRDIPSFLKPSGGAGSGLLASQRGRASLIGGSAGATAQTSTSRGRELLEAALKSRGSRTSQARRSGDAHQPAFAGNSSLTSLNSKEFDKGAAESGAVEKEKAEPAAQHQQQQEATPAAEDDFYKVGAAVLDGESVGVHRRTSTGDYSTASRSYRAADSSDQTSPVLRVPPLMRGHGPEDGGVAGFPGKAQAGAPTRQAGSEPYNMRREAAASASSDLIAGEVNASATEVRDIAHSLSPRSGAIEPLPTPSEENDGSRRSLAASPNNSSAAPTSTGQTEAPPRPRNPFGAPEGNPFLESGTEEEEGAFGGVAAPLADVPVVPVQPPPLPQHAQYTGVPVVPSPPLLTPTETAAPSKAFNPFAEGEGDDDAQPDIPLAPPPVVVRRPQAQQTQHALPTPPLQPSALLPPLPQQRPAADVAPAAAVGVNNGFTTPRSGATGGAEVDAMRHASQPAAGGHQGAAAAAAASAGSAMRGPYAASPFTRDDEERRAVDDESPLPLRPPSFDSVPQPEPEEAYEAGQGIADGVVGREEEEDGFGDHPVQQQQQEVGLSSHEGSGRAHRVARPFKWSGGESGAHTAEEEENESFLGDSGNQSDRARRQTQQPSEIAALAPPTAAAVEQLPNAPPQPPPQQQQQQQPPSSVNASRGAVNPFLNRRPDPRLERGDDIRRQYQEQLQSRIHAAQQAAAPPAAAAAAAPAVTRGLEQSLSHKEEPTRHFSDGRSPQGSPFADSRLGSAGLASAPPPQPHRQPLLPDAVAMATTAAADYSSPLDTQGHGPSSRPSFASASNPFLDVGDDGPAGQGGGSRVFGVGGAAGGETHATPVPLPHHGATHSFSSSTPHKMSPNAFSAVLEPSGVSAPSRHAQPLSNASSVGVAPALSLTEEELNATGNNFLSASGASGFGAAAAAAPASRTPGGSALVNPFSKAARSAAAAAGAATAADASGPSAGASLTSSFAGRRKPRRIGAPCFAIFVGGAVAGVPPSEQQKGVSCIAACFNNPRAGSSPTVNTNAPPAAGRVRSPSAQAMSGSGAVSHVSSFRGPLPNNNGAAMRGAGAGTAAPRVTSGSVDAGNSSSSNSGICIVFCSLVEALTTKGSVVDRKGIRGTESGRRYVRALRDAVLPCALAANEWAATGPKWSEMANAVAALESCVPAPLASVLTIILKDAMSAETQEGFRWKESGGRQLGELLLAAAQAEARKHATTASSGQGNATLAKALTASPLNVDGEGGCCMEPKEKAATLFKVEELLCTGQRVEAVELALATGLYVHALLISMMCPSKDEYLRTVQAVTQKELLLNSPLAHAYNMFNELPQPPLLPPPPPSTKSAQESREDGEGKEEAATQSDGRRGRENALRDKALLKGTWRRHAAVHLANFTRHSGEGLLRLASNLQQLHLVVEAHTCLLLLHLTPLGMAGPVRAGAEPLPPPSSMSAEEIEDVLPRPDQRLVMDEIRRRLGVVGGMYHPTEGCRAGFLTPVTTLLTQLLQLAQQQLDARAPPLAVPGVAGPPVPFHGLPGYPPRGDVGYRMMQVLWLREAGLVRESRQALSVLVQRMAPPVAFSLNAPPRTLNELVYLFGGVPPSSAASSAAARGRGGEPLGSSSQLESFVADSLSPPPPLDGATPESVSGTPQHPSTSASTALAPRSVPEDQLADSHGAGQRSGGERAARGASESLPTSSDERQAGQLPPPPPPSAQHQPSPAPPQRAPPPPAGPVKSALTAGQRAAALQPPARPPPPTHGSAAPPPPPQQQRQQPQSPPQGNMEPPAASPPSAAAAPARSTPKPAPAPAPKSAGRRSRSMDALRNFFFRRGKSEADGGEKAPPAAEEAKPMHLDTEKTPAFDPVTGRWLFPETEEEKKLRELAKQGPPKMASKAAPAPAAPAAAAESAPAPAPAPSVGGTAHPPALPQNGAPVAMKRPPGPLPGGHPAPTHGAPAPTFAPGRGAPPPMMGGRGGGPGARRPGGRQQYVDSFNSTN